MTPQIAILDFGSQYTHLIARRIRQLGVLARIYSPTVDTKELNGAKGLILSGGPQSVYDKKSIKYNKQIFELGVPILGLCYGHQLIVHHFGGRVRVGKVKEYGHAFIRANKKIVLFQGFSGKQQVWMSHGDRVENMPRGFLAAASTVDCPIAAVADEKKKMYGLQFHPEVAHTTHGMRILRNFIFTICGCEKNWSLFSYSRELENTVRKQAGNRKIFLLVSGGVDSTVAFAFLEKTLGKKRVFGLHIDTGFLRKSESEEVRRVLAQAGFDNLVVVDASEIFLDGIRGIVDPEEKRKKIGRIFLQVKDTVMRDYGLLTKEFILGQGTIYPDTIETGGTAHADTIKTHHNRVNEVLRLMKMGKIIEPLKDLYKDEVRELGKALNLPAGLLNRHPFPGPGLAIRTICSSGRESVKNKTLINQRLQKIVGAKFQATVLPLRSVGVQGDSRTYRHPALLSGPLHWKALHVLSREITNRIHEINRVVFLLRLPRLQRMALKNIAVQEAYLTKERINLLRQVDFLVNKEIRRAKIYGDIWQFPVILAPLTLNGGETIILRPVQSQEAMTANFYQMPKIALQKIVKSISQIPEIDLILYDITNKPPATIEWE